MSILRGTLYFGKYKGYVSNNNDPLKMGRLKVSCPIVLGKDAKGQLVESNWALPCVPYAGEDEGTIFVPKVNTGVWVEFEEGDPGKPIWAGCFWSRPAAVGNVSTRTGNELPAIALADYPKNRVIQTKYHSIEFNDKKREFRIFGVEQDVDIAFKEDGTINIENGHHQLVMGCERNGSEFRYEHKINLAQIQVTQPGDISLLTGGSAVDMAKVSGDINIEHKSGTSIAVYQDAVEIDTQDGSAFSVGKDDAKLELKGGQSIMLSTTDDLIELTAKDMNMDCSSVQLSDAIVQQPLMVAGFFTLYNAMRLLLATHTHTSAAPGVQTAVSAQLVPLLVPDVPAPGVNVTAQVTGG